MASGGVLPGPVRLLQPTRLAGRDDEVAVLEAAFEGALNGRCCAVLVTGAPGVGKTALADHLRAVVAGRDGWFVSGTFDASRRDLESDAVYQAFRALGRLLLAEPADELTADRGRIVRAVGANTALVTAIVPEFAALLAVPAHPGDPLTAQVRAQRAALEVLRAVASPRRPLVVFVDDLQWAGRTPLGLVDLVLSEEPVEGLLLVGAYRDGELDAAHPLLPLLSRWRGKTAVRHLRLDNLPVSGLAAMAAQMLHVDQAVAVGLAEMIEPHTRGNPYETVELLNALRRDGVLTAAPDGWRWDEATVRAHLDQSDVAGLLAARAAALPESSRQVVEAMAGLGGRAELSLLRAATAEPADVLKQKLAPALDEGLLVAEPGECAHEIVRFRHDRIREVIVHGVDEQRRRALQWATARRLAGVPEAFAVAAEQYLPVAGAVDDPAERRAVVGLLKRAAGQASLIGDYALVDALLAAALRLIDPGEAAALTQVHTARHAALFSMGRPAEADEEYRSIEELSATVVDRAEATAVQVRSLTHRNRLADAVTLAVGGLRECGITVPAPDRLPAELDHQRDHLYRWLDRAEAADELARPYITDPSLLAATRLLNEVLVAAYYTDLELCAWLGLEALRIWLEHGPSRTLFGAAGAAAVTTVALGGDRAAGYRAGRRILRLGEARGYEPESSQTRHRFALLSWCFEPIENGVQAARRAREGLIAGGELVYAGHTYHPTAYYLLDCAPTLDSYADEVEAGLAFARRTGSEQVAQWLDHYRWLAGVLRGESSAVVGEPVSTEEGYARNPTALLYDHITRATAAAVLGDPSGLVSHSAAAMPLLSAAPGLYPTAVAHLLRALALAGQVRTTDNDQRGGLLTELDHVTRWLAARAADSPDNFLHLLRLVEAERAWAAGDSQAAALAYDAARREAAQRQRPWHQALIAEHAARFYLTHGLDHAGYDLLVQARQQYLAWGATAKTSQLDRDYPALRTPAGAIVGDGAQPGDQGRAVVTTGTIDLLGILSASQALSSETSIDRLHARVVEVLSAMTGATGVHLPLWSEDRHGWLLPAPDGHGGAVPVSGTGHERAVPMSVLRHAQRTREPLVVADAVRDDRFACDPYLAGVQCCSLLAVPILSRGALRAVLLLENRLLQGAFTAERLDAVTLIAGQLAVSFDNAQLYAEFRRMAGEQAALRRVATMAARAAAPQEALGAVAEEAGRLLGVDVAVLLRYDDPQEAVTTVTMVATWTGTGAPVPTPVGSRLPLGGRNVTTLVYRTGQPARIDYAERSGAIGQVATHDWGMRSSVGVPISVEGRLWGVMMVGSAHEELLPADTEARLAGFTDLAATAIANAQARSELRDFGEEQAALRRVATLVARAGPPEEVFATVTEEAGRLLTADLAVLNRYAPDGTRVVVGSWTRTGAPPVAIGLRVPVSGRNVTSLVFETGRSARIDGYADTTGPISDLAREAGVQASVGVPISVAGELWGVIIVASRSAPLPADTEARLAGFTELAATAVANAEAHAEVAASRARIVAAADQTRRRIERDLHDGAQQRLVSLALRLRAAQANLPDELGAQLDHAVAEATGALDELRKIAHGLHPAILADHGLAPALKTLARRSPVPVNLQLQVDRRLPEPVEVSAYHVIAEALTNAAKHAGASAVSVQILLAGEVLLLAVRDDGAGGADFTRGTGLAGLKDRVEALGGRLFLDSPRGAGTSLRVELPLTAPNGDATAP